MRLFVKSFSSWWLSKNQPRLTLPRTTGYACVDYLAILRLRELAQTPPPMAPRAEDRPALRPVVAHGAGDSERPGAAQCLARADALRLLPVSGLQQGEPYMSRGDSAARPLRLRLPGDFLGSDRRTLQRRLLGSRCNRRQFRLGFQRLPFALGTNHSAPAFFTSSLASIALQAPCGQNPRTSDRCRRTASYPAFHRP